MRCAFASISRASTSRRRHRDLRDLARSSRVRDSSRRPISARAASSCRLRSVSRRPSLVDDARRARVRLVDDAARLLTRRGDDLVDLGLGVRERVRALLGGGQAVAISVCRCSCADDQGQRTSCRTDEHGHRDHLPIKVMLMSRGFSVCRAGVAAAAKPR